MITLNTKKILKLTTQFYNLGSHKTNLHHQFSSYLKTFKSKLF